MLDADGYLQSVERCRREFPDLHILTGVELGQPHLDEARAREVVDLDILDRVNGSLHTIPTTDEPGSVRSEPYTLYRLWPAGDVVRGYLVELLRMIAVGGSFAVVTHIEYAVRYWPAEREGPFDPKRFEDAFREAMRAIAGSGPGARAQHRRADPTLDPAVVARGGRPGGDDRQRRAHPRLARG